MPQKQGAWRPKAVIGLAALAVLAGGLALLPSRASDTQPDAKASVLGRQYDASDPSATGTTTISFSPASNPAFKVIGATTCHPNRSGRLWVDARLTAQTVFDARTDRVEVTFAGGGSTPPVVLTLSPSTEPAWEATLPATRAIACKAVSGSRLTYTARSFRGKVPQHSQVGSYDITIVD